MGTTAVTPVIATKARIIQIAIRVERLQRAKRGMMFPGNIRAVEQEIAEASREAFYMAQQLYGANGVARRVEV